MDKKLQTSVEDIGHLGLVAAIVEKFQIVKQMDSFLPIRLQYNYELLGPETLHSGERTERFYSNFYIGNLLKN